MLAGTNLKYAKAHNLRIVLETIRLHEPIARKTIAHHTGLRLQTVSNITRQLLKARLIQEADRLQEGRGAPVTPLALHPGGAFTVGLDFDREHITGVLMDFRGQVRQRVAYEVFFPPPEEAIDLMVKAVETLVQAADIDMNRLWGIGIGLPGPLGVSEGSRSVNVVNPTAYPGWMNVPIADLLEARLNLPVFIENNASAAAVGERWYGKGRHIENFFYLFFGVGLGGGLILNGRPYDGHNGNAGEIGAVPTPTDLTPSIGLKKPHLGAFFSLPVIAGFLKPSGVEISHPAELGDLFDQKNQVLLNWLDQGIAQLAPFILTIECLIDPEAIFLGGQYPEPMIRYIKERLKETLPERRIEDGMAHPQLYCATAGDDATALGAATLPMFSSFAPIPEVLMKHAVTGPGIFSHTEP